MSKSDHDHVAEVADALTAFAVAGARCLDIGVSLASAQDLLCTIHSVQKAKKAKTTEVPP